MRATMINPYAPPQAVVQDIADPAAGVLLADRPTRLGAAILDGLILSVLVYGPLVVGAIVGGPVSADADDNAGLTGLGLGFGLAGVGFVAWLWVTIKYLKANGQSIGKKACGIKIVRRDGSPVSVSRVIWLRNVVNTLIGIIPLYGFIDTLFIFGEARRCIHDHLADTIVIKA
jgi:uncharacterized RDD family membrane protein YckC